MIRFALPFTVLTLGLGVLALNGLVVLIVAHVLPGVEVDGLLAAVVVAVVLTALTTLVSAVLAIDDEDRVMRHLARRAARRSADVQQSDVPGVLFMEIDGLAYEVLRRALRDGNAPALASWVHAGTHRLIMSQTGACQAGLLHGSNDDMPAFRWWEKEHGRAIVTNRPRDAAELERRVSNGRGLLHAGGASRANILSGDAPHTLLTMSTVLGIRRPGQRIGSDYYTYFGSPYNVARTLLLSLADIAFELRAATEQRRRDVRPRGHRGLRYAVLRAWATVVQRDLQIEAVLADVYAGRPSSTRRSWPTTRSRITRASSVPTRSRCCAASTARSRASSARRDTPRARITSSCSRTTGRRRARRSCSAMASPWRRSSRRRARPARWTPRHPPTTRRSGGWARR